jgi:hypothetical protein
MIVWICIGVTRLDGLINHCEQRCPEIKTLDLAHEWDYAQLEIQLTGCLSRPEIKRYGACLIKDK